MKPRRSNHLGNVKGRTEMASAKSDQVITAEPDRLSEHLRRMKTVARKRPSAEQISDLREAMADGLGKLWSTLQPDTKKKLGLFLGNELFSPETLRPNAKSAVGNEKISWNHVRAMFGALNVRSTAEIFGFEWDANDQKTIDRVERFNCTLQTLCSYEVNKR